MLVLVLKDVEMVGDTIPNPRIFERWLTAFTVLNQEDC